MKVINENQLLLSSRGDLLCLYLNARSLINKKEEFEAKQKALESIVLPILQNLSGGAGGAGGMPGGFPGGGFPGGGFPGADSQGPSSSAGGADDGPKIEEID